MIDVEKVDNILYRSIYGQPRVGNYNKIWDKIKNNSNILREATKVKRDKFDENDIVNGLAICDSMLIDYKNVDEIAYKNLIDTIYSNADIARIVLGGAANGGFSFLLMSLWNHNIELTDEQKAFAVDEAMNKIGTVRWEEQEQNFSDKLDKMGVSDDNTTFINVDGSLNLIGEKTHFEYMNYMFSSLSKTQAHGVGEFDIRYHILRNPNWSLEEKKKLIMDFWCDDENYSEFLEQWEWGIINDSMNFKNSSASLFEIEYLYECSYDILLKFYEDKEIADRIWNEIKFCKQMRELRPKKTDECLSLIR